MACLARSGLLRLYRPQPALPLVQSTLQVQQIHAQKQRPFSHSIQTPSPQHPNTQSAPTHTQTNEIETLITTHSLAHSLRQNPLYKESRSHLAIPPPSLRATHLVAGSLSGEGMVSVPPFVWTAKPTTSSSSSISGTPSSSSTSTSNNSTESEGRTSKSSVMTIFHLGPNVTGHPGYIHGGQLSIMFDEAFARCVSLSFGSGLGMTANLNVDFRRPALPGRLFVACGDGWG